MDYDIEPGEQVSSAVIRAVSRTVDRDPRSIQPLAEVLDPDALDALFARREEGTERPGGEVSFVFNRCRVTVQNGEYVSVSRLDFEVDLADGRSENR